MEVRACLWVLVHEGFQDPLQAQNLALLHEGYLASPGRAFFPGLAMPLDLLIREVRSLA